MQGEAMTKRKRGWNYFEACRANLTPEAKRNSRIFTVWCLGWALSFVGAAWLLRILNDVITDAAVIGIAQLNGRSCRSCRHTIGVVYHIL